MKQENDEVQAKLLKKKNKIQKLKKELEAAQNFSFRKDQENAAQYESAREGFCSNQMHTPQKQSIKDKSMGNIS